MSVYYLCYADCRERDPDEETKDHADDGHDDEPHAFVGFPMGAAQAPGQDKDQNKAA